LLLDPLRACASIRRSRPGVRQAHHGIAQRLVTLWAGTASTIPSSAPALAARGTDRTSVGVCPLASEAAMTGAALRLN
jgi:hypothetical protein